MHLNKKIYKLLSFLLVFSVLIGYQPLVSAAANTSQVETATISPDKVSFIQITPKTRKLLEKKAVIDEDIAKAYGTSTPSLTLEETIVNGLTAKASNIDISSYKILRADFSSIYWSILDNHPELFYVLGSISWRYNNAGYIITIEPEYDTTTDFDYDAFDREMDLALQQVSDDMTDLEKALVIHDYLVEHIAYDNENYIKMENGTGSIPDICHCAYGAMVNGVAVCDGYADSFLYLMNKLGIPCEEISGGNHAWNLIQIGGTWYQLDCTFDDPVWDVLGRVNHEYFLMSDSLSKKNHTWTTANYKACTNTTYDNFTINTAKAKMIYNNGLWYYINSSSKDYCSINLKVSNAAPKVIKNLSYTWNVIDSTRYWTGSYSRMTSMNNSIVYSTPTELRSMNIDGSEDTLIKNVAKYGYNLYGMDYKNNVFRLQYGIKPSTDSTNYASYQSNFAMDTYSPSQTSQTLTGTSSYSKKYGEDAFALDVISDQNQPLSYHSSDSTVATVDSTGTVTITGAGSTTITVTAKSSIDYSSATKKVIINVAAKSFTNQSITVITPTVAYSGIALTPNVTVDGLVKNKDYQVTYSNNKNVGTGQITVTGINNYTGTLTSSFTITPRILDTNDFTLAKGTYTYTGGQITPKLQSTLVPNQDYTYFYLNNTNVGKGSIIIKGKGNCSGQIVKNFNIVSAPNGSFTMQTPNSNPANTANGSPAVNTKITTSNLQFTVTNSATGKQEVSFTKVLNNKTSISIPNTIRIGSINFKVTSIAANAFANKKKLKKVTIGSNVKKINSKAFYNCKKLKTITIKSKVLKSVGSKAIKGIYKKATIKCPKSKLAKYKKLFKKKTGFVKSMKVKK